MCFMNKANKLFRFHEYKWKITFCRCGHTVTIFNKNCKMPSINKWKVAQTLWLQRRSQYTLSNPKIQWAVEHDYITSTKKNSLKKISLHGLEKESKIKAYCFSQHADIYSVYMSALFLFLLHVFSSYIIVLDRKITVFEVIVSLSESLVNGNFLMGKKDHDT